MHIEHVAVWTRDLGRLERLRAFYVTYFDAVAGPQYASQRRPGFMSYFLAFPGTADGRAARLELMTVPDLVSPAADEVTGYAHLAVALPSCEAVEALVARMRADGVLVESGPRLTGDGYYEAAVRDPDGNLVELIADPQPRSIG